jgi:FkbM family methyltransferase
MTVRQRFFFRLMGLLRVMGFDLVSRRWIRRVAMQKLGSHECGWNVPHVAPTKGDLCFCFGAGEDVTFDVALRQQRGCVVHTFDPTPRAIAHYESLPADQRRCITFHPVGIWVEDRRMTFYAPANTEHVSHSVVALQSSHVGFSAECRSIGSIIARVGGGLPVAIKLDIEGAEMHVLAHVLEHVQPKLLLVEFDELNGASAFENWIRVRSVVRDVCAKGYHLYWVENANYGFVRTGALVVQ